MTSAASENLVSSSVETLEQKPANQKDTLTLVAELVDAMAKELKSNTDSRLLGIDVEPDGVTTVFRRQSHERSSQFYTLVNPQDPDGIVFKNLFNIKSELGSGYVEAHTIDEVREVFRKVLLSR